MRAWGSGFDFNVVRRGLGGLFSGVGPLLLLAGLRCFGLVDWLANLWPMERFVR